MLTIARADGDASSISFDDLAAWNARDAHAFARLSGPTSARISLMYARIAHYLAVRLVQKLPCHAEISDPELLTIAVHDDISFAELAHLAAPDNALRQFLPTFQRRFCQHLTSLVMMTDDVALLLAALDTKRLRSPALHDIAFERLRAMRDPDTDRALLAALRHHPNVLTAEKLVCVLGEHAVWEALPDVLALAASPRTSDIVRGSALRALRAIVMLYPERTLDLLLDALTTAPDAAPFSQQQHSLEWLVDTVFPPDALSTAHASNLVRAAERFVKALDHAVRAAVSDHHDVRPYLIGIIGHIGVPCALQVLQDYLRDDALHDCADRIVRGIAGVHAQLAARALPAAELRPLIESSQRALAQNAAGPRAGVLDTQVTEISPTTNVHIAYRSQVLALRHAPVAALARGARGTAEQKFDATIPRNGPGAALEDLLKTVYARHAPHARYDIVAIFEAPRAFHEEDPQQLNRAVMDGMAQAWRGLLDNSDIAPWLATTPLPRRIESVVVFGTAATWRCRLRLVPHRSTPRTS